MFRKFSWNPDRYGSTYEMRMRKGDPSYSITQRRTLMPEIGTRLKVQSLLPGIRQLSGEKIQWYLASELRERIRLSGVKIKIVDRQARKEYAVAPRQFTGQLLHNLPAPATPFGEVYIELYLNEPGSGNEVGLYRSGTRILKSPPRSRPSSARRGPRTSCKAKQFFEYAGPLFSVRISPGSCTLAVGQSRAFHAIARDRARNPIPDNVAFAWRILQGEGRIEETGGEFATYHAPEEPGLVRLGVTANQGETSCMAEALVTVTDALIPESRERPATRQGLPGYTFEHAPGQLWRSRFDANQNLIIINSGHRDFIFASRTKALKLRYIARLFAKEMVYKNFPGLSRELILERLIELSLFTEEYLR